MRSNCSELGKPSNPHGQVQVFIAYCLEIHFSLSVSLLHKFIYNNNVSVSQSMWTVNMVFYDLWRTVVSNMAWDWSHQSHLEEYYTYILLALHHTCKLEPLEIGSRFLHCSNLATWFWNTHSVVRDSWKKEEILKYHLIISWSPNLMMD